MRRDDQDLGWLAAIAAETGGPILELACGTGRIAAPLASTTGLPVVGLDLDADMAAAARRRGVTAVVRGDMRRFAFRPVFALVIVAYNSVQLLDDGGRTACLVAAATAAVRPGGRLALECTDFQQDIQTAVVGPELLASHDGIDLFGTVEHDLAGRTSVYRRRFERHDPEHHQIEDRHTQDRGDLVRTDEVTIASLREDDVLALLSTTGWQPLTTERDGARFRVVATLSGA